MSDQWDSYITQFDGRPTSIILNMGFARSAPMTRYGFSAAFRIKMQHPREDGLSSTEEWQTLAAFEEAIMPGIVADGTAIYVGSRTGGGYRDFAFYTEDVEAFRSAVAAAMSAYPGYQHRVGIKPDPQWRFYFDVLYPPPRTVESMGNRAVLDNLARHGDRHEEPRTIDHLAIFHDRSKCDAFVQLVVSQGFSIREGCPTYANGTLVLHFSRTDRPVEIDAIVLPLFDAVTALGGEYDGWGCTIVTEPGSGAQNS